MPIYEYHCESCDNDFEKLVLGGKEPKECPSCAGGPVKRKVSAFSFKSTGGSRASSSSSSCGGCSASSCAGCSSS